MMEAGPFSTPPIRRFRLGIGGALLVSLVFHGLLILWLMFSGAGDLILLPVHPVSLVASKSPSSLQFTFVDLPDDRAVAENNRARLLSDKTRVARQSVPTPPDATQFSEDPHSVGNSRIRQLMRPPAGAPPLKAPSSPSNQQAEATTKDSEAAPGSEGTTNAAGEPASNAPSLTEQGPREDGHGQSGNRGGNNAAEDRRASFQQALKQLASGTYDFSGFDNPAYLHGNNYGTLSFDTKGFDWGDYARQLYLIIKKNWYDRIPIAAYYGQKGKVFIRFVIEKNGTITDLAVIRSSDVSPLDRAAENAIRASNPLPPLPSNFPKDAEGVTFGFYYNLPLDEQ